jgi:tRNA A-37 threonylcarbamoyl transferase component Bud32
MHVPSCSKCGGPLDGATGDVCPKCLLSLGVGSEMEKPLEAGSMFHGLEIVQILGRGGMGVVYKARQPQLDRHVALKVLPRAMAADAEFAQRFMREARALAALQHPNIVAVHDFGKEGDQYFFVMEYVDGTNLRAIMREGRLTADEALRIIPPLCDALFFAHQEGVVHRDIKPENVLLDRKGRVKVADFGLAKMLGGEATVLQNMTQSNVVMGTPHYMAPEQLENAKHVDHRADIYSLGVMLYEMLTGELPIGRFEAPSKRVQVDVRLDEIVLRTLEKSPEKRYQSMSEVSKEISRLTDKGTVRSTASASSLPMKAVGLVVALLLVALVIFLIATRTPSGPPPTEAIRAALAGADAPLAALLASAPETKDDLESAEAGAAIFSKASKILVDEKDGVGVALFEGPALKGRVEFKAVKKDKGWEIVELSLAKSGFKLAWNGSAWTRVDPPKRDPWAVATLSKDELPPGWRFDEDPVEGEARSAVTRSLGRWGMADLSDGVLKTRDYSMAGPGKFKLDVYLFNCKDPAALDKLLKQFQQKWLIYNRALLDKENVLVWVVGATSDGRLNPVVQSFEDLFRTKLALGPAKRVDNSLVTDADLPAGWTALSGPDKVSKAGEIDRLLAPLKGMIEPKIEDIRDGWLGSFGEKGSNVAAHFVSIRFFEDDPVRELVQALRTCDPPPSKEMEVLAYSNRLIVAFHDTRDPAKQAPFVALCAKISERIGYSAGRLDVRAKGVETVFDESGMSLVFEVEGANARTLTGRGPWAVTLWTRWNYGYDLTLPPPALTRIGSKLKGTLKIPMNEELRLFLEVVPTWVSARAKWDAKAELQFDFSLSDIDEKLPAIYRKAFGILFFVDNDLPPGWQTAREWDRRHMPVIASGEDVEKGGVLSFFDDVGKPAASTVRFTYLNALVPQAKLENFEGLVFVMLEFVDDASAKALADKVREAKNLARSDKAWVELAGRRLVIGLLYGSNGDAERTGAKVVASVKARMNP